MYESGSGEMMRWIQYPDGIFKVATIDKWMVVVTGRKRLDELRKAPDDALSFQEATDEVCSRPG